MVAHARFRRRNISYISAEHVKEETVQSRWQVFNLLKVLCRFFHKTFVRTALG